MSTVEKSVLIIGKGFKDVPTVMHFLKGYCESNYVVLSHKVKCVFSKNRWQRNFIAYLPVCTFYKMNKKNQLGLW